MSRLTRPSTIALGVGALSVGAVLALGQPAQGHTGRGEETSPEVVVPQHPTPDFRPKDQPHVVVADPTSDLAEARRATRPFRSVVRSTRAGYALPPEGPLHQCVTDYKNTGAMGFHLINGANAGDTVLDPAEPEALVYHRDDRGQVRLGALEYVVDAAAWKGAGNGAPPRVMGQEMMLVEAPNRYELPSFYMLHVWLWKRNPLGIYSPWNARVSCHADEPPEVPMAGSVDDDDADTDLTPPPYRAHHHV